MKAFDNSTTAGNEKAIRKGKRVPPEDVNLAFYKSPELSPEENLVIVDTSKVSEDSVKLSGTGCKLFYANEVGVLVDENSNAVVTDSSPAITNEFLREEDYSFIPGNEYRNSDILPYEHRSRYFHLEKAGLSFAGLATSYNSESIKVVDKNGEEYSKYKIRLIPANIPGYSLTGDNWAYRVLVYIDTKEIEELYLAYDKVEIDEDGNISSVPNTDHKEILNPRHFFKNVPEESDVVDPASFDKRIFATRPITADAVDIGRNTPPGVDGYKVYVPKKAIPDPRIYQLFRWRVNVDFIQDSSIDPGGSVQTIKCGVLKLSGDTKTRSDFAFMNLGNSRFNASGVSFVNPNSNTTDNQRRSYWHVNLDQDDLTEYDILLMAPFNAAFDIDPYLPKLRDFVKNKGGTLLFDTWSRVDLHKKLGGELSAPVKVTSGANFSSVSPVTGSLGVDTLVAQSSSELIDGAKSLGGWDIKDNVDYLSHFTFNSSNFVQFFNSIAGDADSAIEGTNTTVMDRKLGEGRIIVTTMGQLLTVSQLYDYVDNSMVAGPGTNPVSNANYKRNINGEGVEGAYKFLYNAALASTKSRVLDDSDESSFSSSWKFSTPWKGSWVINAFDDVLTDDEKQQNNFAIDALDPDNNDFTPVWKRKLSSKTIEQLVEEELAKVVRNDPVLAARINESSRSYSIQITNPKVQVDSDIKPQDSPQAWTTAYSPKFTIPENIAPYIVKEPVDEDGKKGIKPDFGPVEAEYTEYPDTPYGGRVRIVNATSEEFLSTVKTNYTVTGTATGTKTVTVDNPDIITQVPITTATSVKQEISWAKANQTWKEGKGTPTSEGTMYKANSFPVGFIKPVGIRTWQDYNYKNSSFGNGNLLWPYMGFQSRIQRGSSGDLVKYVQESFNRFRAAGYLSASKLTVDGDFGPITKTAVENFQTAIKARYVDGIVDAETWWLIAAWIQRLYKDGKAGDNYLGLYNDSFKIQMHRISNGTDLAYAKRSWVKNGPSTVWDLIAITFDQQYDIEAVSITPWAPGSGDLMFRSLHIKNGNDLTNWSASNSFLKNMTYRPKDGQKFTLPFSKRRGNTIVVGLGQDKPYKSGQTARFLGVKDITATVMVDSTSTSYQRVVEDGGTSVKEYQENFSFEVTGSVSVTAEKDVVVTLEYPGGDGYKSVSNISFDSIVVSNSDVLASLSGNRATFTTQVIDTAQGTDVRQGPAFPGGTYYSKTPSGVVDTVPETGWTNKREGVKLLCKADGTPYGFPPLPTSTSGSLTRHYMSLSIMPDGNGQDTYVAFYDQKDQEFITSASGEAEMSYLEYFSRGPQNVYVAVISEYETTEQEVVPDDVDAPRIPYKTAMPVYGVCVDKGSEITLESPPSGLNLRDVWPIAVRTGQYRRKRRLRSRSQGKLSGYLAGYQDSEVTAIYSVPEAALDSGSEIYGPGKEDVVSEQPKILDDDVIQVRQPSIYLAERFVRGTAADPVTPVMKVYKRATTGSPWVQLQAAEIKDYNVSTGEIFLRDKLTSTDPALLKVDYTSEQPFHSMYVSKSGQRINLNVFVGMMEDYVGKPIYVYLLPHYVLDSTGEVIQESYTDRALEITSDPGIFDSTSPTYNPLAVQLGVIYTSDATDINELALFDTRTRGGGARDSFKLDSGSLTDQEIARILNESMSYWDSKNPPTVSYPKQGYVRVQLPSAVLNYLEDERVKQAIERNLTAGTGFDIDYV